LLRVSRLPIGCVAIRKNQPGIMLSEAKHRISGLKSRFFGYASQ
jgi:hypothetical protein